MPPDASGSWDKSYQLTCDGWNRLVKVEDEIDATVATYVYDGDSRRTMKTVGSEIRHYYYSNHWKPLEERVGASTSPERQYVWGARNGHRDELILRDRDTNGDGNLNERLYCLMDYFSPISIINTSGAVQERYDFSTFGLQTIMGPDWAPLSSFSFESALPSTASLSTPKLPTMITDSAIMLLRSDGGSLKILSRKKAG